MSKRKRKPGVCGVCGCAVVQAAPRELEDAIARSFRNHGAWTNGHYYVDGKLEQVRCRDHEPRDGGWDEMPLC